jgi:hypothetical protein
MTTFTTEDRILAEKDGTLTVNVNAGEVTLVNKDLTDEPVAWAREDGVIAFFEKPKVDKQGFKWFPLYTHPAKTLTDEEIDELANKYLYVLNDIPYSNDIKDFARAILRKAQEK